jgi:hypothetical protein
MKSYKLFLPLLAVLLLLSASSVFAEDITKNVSGATDPVWTAPKDLGMLANGTTITVVNQCTYNITVQFLNSADVQVGSPLSVLASATSPATPIPLSQTDAALNTARIAVYKTSPVGAKDYLTVRIGIGIPTLSEWAMIVFSVLLLGMMTYYVVRRRRITHSWAV